MTLEEEYRLSCYEELTTLGNHNHIFLIKHKLSGEIFVKKVLSRFSLDVYKQLRDLQISGIPKIHDLILENNSLILIEDYIHGHRCLRNRQHWSIRMLLRSCVSFVMC